MFKTKLYFLELEFTVFLFLFYFHIFTELRELIRSLTIGNKVSEMQERNFQPRDLNVIGKLEKYT